MEENETYFVKIIRQLIIGTIDGLANVVSDPGD
jgi:hypothetical protein